MQNCERVGQAIIAFSRPHGRKYVNWKESNNGTKQVLL